MNNFYLLHILYDKLLKLNNVLHQRKINRNNDMDIFLEKAKDSMFYQRLLFLEDNKQQFLQFLEISSESKKDMPISKWYLEIPWYLKKAKESMGEISPWTFDSETTLFVQTINLAYTDFIKTLKHNI